MCEKVLFDDSNHEMYSNYNKRVAEDMKIVYWVVLIMAVFIWLIGEGIYAIIIPAAIGLLSYWRARNRDRAYIYKIALDDDRLKILYYDTNEMKTLEGGINNFEFQIKSTWSRNPVYYLIVTFQKGLEIKQFPGGKWTSKDVNEVMRQIKDIRL